MSDKTITFDQLRFMTPVDVQKHLEIGIIKVTSDGKTIFNVTKPAEVKHIPVKVVEPDEHELVVQPKPIRYPTP